MTGSARVGRDRPRQGWAPQPRRGLVHEVTRGMRPAAAELGIVLTRSGSPAALRGVSRPARVIPRPPRGVGAHGNSPRFHRPRPVEPPLPLAPLTAPAPVGRLRLSPHAPSTPGKEGLAISSNEGGEGARGLPPGSPQPPGLVSSASRSRGAG